MLHKAYNQRALGKLASFYMKPYRKCIFIDTVAKTVYSTVDTTKNVAAAAVEKGTTFIGTAKGITCFKSHLILTF